MPDTTGTAGRGNDRPPLDKDEWILRHAQEIADQEADAAAPAGGPAPGPATVTPRHVEMAEQDWVNFSALALDLQTFGWSNDDTEHG